MESVYVDWNDPQGLLKSLNAEKAARSGIKSPEERRNAPLPQQTGDMLLATDPNAWHAQQDQLYNDIVNQPVTQTLGNMKNQANEATREEVRKKYGDKADNLTDDQLTLLRHHSTELDASLNTKYDIEVSGKTGTTFSDIKSTLAGKQTIEDPNIFDDNQLTGEQTAVTRNKLARASQATIDELGLSPEEAQVDGASGLLKVWSTKDQDWKIVEPSIADDIWANKYAIAVDVALTGVGIAASATGIGAAVSASRIGSVASKALQFRRIQQLRNAAKSAAGLTGLAVVTDTVGHTIDYAVASNGELPDFEHLWKHAGTTAAYTYSGIKGLKTGYWLFKHGKNLRHPLTFAKDATSAAVSNTPVVGGIVKKTYSNLRRLASNANVGVKAVAKSQLDKTLMTSFSAQNIMKAGSVDEILKRYETLGLKFDKNATDIEKRSFVHFMANNNDPYISNIISSEGTGDTIEIKNNLYKFAQQLNKGIDDLIDTVHVDSTNANSAQFISTFQKAREELDTLTTRILNQNKEILNVPLYMNGKGVPPELLQVYKDLFDNDYTRHYLRSVSKRRITPSTIDTIARNDPDNINSGLAAFLKGDTFYPNINLSLRDAVEMMADIQHAITKIESQATNGAYIGKGLVPKDTIKQLRTLHDHLKNAFQHRTKGSLKFKLETLQEDLDLDGVLSVLNKADDARSILKQMQTTAEKTKILDNANNLTNYMKFWENMVGGTTIDNLPPPSIKAISEAFELAGVQNAQELIEMSIIKALQTKYFDNGFYKLDDIVKQLDNFSSLFTSTRGKVFHDLIKEINGLYGGYTQIGKIKVPSSTKTGLLSGGSIATTWGGRLAQYHISLSNRLIGWFVPKQGAVNSHIKDAFRNILRNPMSVEFRNAFDAAVDTAVKQNKIDLTEANTLKQGVKQFSNDIANAETSDIAQQYDQRMQTATEQAKAQGITDESEIEQVLDDMMFDQPVTEPFISPYGKNKNAAAAAIEILGAKMDTADINELNDDFITILADNIKAGGVTNPQALFEDTKQALLAIDLRIPLDWNQAEKLIQQKLNTGVGQ